MPSGHERERAERPPADKAGRSNERPRHSDMVLPAELGEAVGFQVRRASAVADTLFTETFGDMEINAAQYAILMVVRSNPGCQTAAAGSMLGITPNNLVPLLDSLTARGYIRRTLSATDRRVRHLRLTPHGQDLATRLVERHQAMQAAIEARIGHGNLEEFLRLLTLYCA